MHAGIVPLVNAAADGSVAPPPVNNAILDAARDMKVDPDLLTAIAWRESRFDPTASNHRSSARGLLQFTSETWLRDVRDFGAQHGAADYAAAIHKESSGQFVVRYPYTREAILKLRSDPVLSAWMAVESMARQRAAAQPSLRRSVTSTDLYLFHVLGPSGSARFLTAMAKRPSASTFVAASPKVLRNAGLLASDGRPMTLGNTYKAIGVMLHAHRSCCETVINATESQPSNHPPIVEVKQTP